ncbi:hypothetical protein AV530_003725 [Patagioenas fasciata monilis]|uniref:Secreted protein n=1 Tax=Patagioenas fasciata monilis TaxID=372326 RepID=A0A1V4KYL8_PATFA|nr:hypothetical protein AV530_003725 [Patagioenas fasciata monilis]
MLHTSQAGIGVTPAFCVVVLFLLQTCRGVDVPLTTRCSSPRTVFLAQSCTVALERFGSPGAVLVWRTPATAAPQGTL